jgi:type II secretory pathway pseudopilin PulG
MASRLRRRLAGEAGMGLIEALVAALILLGGILGTLSVINGSRDLGSVNERKQTAVHRAEQQLEKARAVGYANLAIKTAPGAGTGDDPRAQVSGTNYDWDASSASNPVEPLVINDVSTSLDTREVCDCGRYSGTVDTFVTQVTTDLKRVTVAVKLDGTQAPRKATIVSTLISRQARRTP